MIQDDIDKLDGWSEKSRCYSGKKTNSLKAYVAISRFDIVLGRFLAPMSKRIYRIH